MNNRTDRRASQGPLWVVLLWLVLVWALAINLCFSITDDAAETTIALTIAMPLMALLTIYALRRRLKPAYTKWSGDDEKKME